MSVIHLKNVIREKLKENNMRACDVERVAELSQGSIHRILAGTTQNPTIETVQSIAHVFGCTVDEMLGSDKGNLDFSIPEFFEWDNDLMKEIFLYTFDYIKENNIKTNLSYTIYFILENYYFCLRKSKTEFDKDFFYWLASNKFKKSKIVLKKKSK